MLKRFLKIGCVALGTLVAMNCEGMKGPQADANMQQLKQEYGSAWVKARAAQIDALATQAENRLKAPGEAQNSLNTVDGMAQALQDFAGGGNLPENSGLPEGENVDEYRGYVKKVIQPDEDVEDKGVTSEQRRRLIAQILLITGKKIGELKSFQFNKGDVMSDDVVGLESYDYFTLIDFTLMFHVSESLFKEQEPMSVNTQHGTGGIYNISAMKLLRGVSKDLPAFSEWEAWQVGGRDMPKYQSLDLLNFSIVINGFKTIYDKYKEAHPETSPSDIALAVLSAWNWMAMPFDQSISKFRGNNKKQANKFAGHTPLTLAVKKLAVMILKESDQTDLNEAVPVYLEMIKYIADHLDAETNATQIKWVKRTVGEKEETVPEVTKNAPFDTPIPGFRPNGISEDRTVGQGYSDFLVWLVTDAWMKGKVTGKVLKDAFELGMYLRGKQLIEKNINGGFIDQAWNIINRKGWKETYPGLAAK